MQSNDVAVQQQEKLQPLFIGLKNQALYGCHHEAYPGVRKNISIVICSPVGHEYERCHRAIKQLASALCKVGFDVLRFDYTGTGDSAGDYEQSDLESWKSDTDRAITFFKNRTGTEQVVMLGLRLGATIAQQVASQRSDIAALVLWSPCLVGNDLLSQWREMQNIHQQKLGYDLNRNQITEILGFGLSENVREQLETLAMTHKQIVDKLSYPSCIIDSQVEAWQEVIPASGHIQIHSSEGSQIWMEEAMQARVPMHNVNTIVNWLQGAIA